MTSCLRCGDRGECAGQTGRFQLKAWDRTDSSLVEESGALCPDCWDRLMRFLAGGSA